VIFACQLTKEECHRDPPCEPHVSCWLAQRFAKLLSQLSEPSSVAAAVTALNSMLKAEKLSFNDVANVLEEQRYSAEDMQHALNRGKELVRRELGSQDSALEFFDLDGRPNWFAIATHNRDNIGKLRRDWDREFTTDMVAKTIAYEPSLKQAKNILRIFVQLGGRCDPRIKAEYF
jgi:hypothetical protein